MRCRTYTLLLVAWCLAMGSGRAALAIGWDSDDFLIGGGPSFTTRIGVFDHDLTFKGYLDSNFVAVSGMDFDQSGRLVAVSGGIRTVRIYDSSGAIVDGFVRPDDAMGIPGDLKVAVDGSYVVGTQAQLADGARQFATTGSFIRQFGGGNINGIAVLPNNRLWIGGPGQPITIYDFATGNSVGTFSLPTNHGAQSMSYSALTGSTLLVDRAEALIFEAGPNGDIQRVFDDPGGQLITSVTRGPNGDVFATTTATGQELLHWRADGSFVGAISLPQFSGWIVWAGNAPEPTGGLVTLAVASILLKRRHRSSS